MTGQGRFFLIGYLLQGVLSRDDFAIMVPEEIEALSGSCVLIPCTFEFPSEYDNDMMTLAKGLWKKGGTNGHVIFDSSNTDGNNEIAGTLVGQVHKKNCTTVLDNFPLSYSDSYYFRVENPSGPLNFNLPKGVKIMAQDTALKPSLTPEQMEVTEGTSVTLNCSAAAPCPKLPPNLTWTPSLGDSVHQLQENEDKTKYVSSILTFTASDHHHEQKITCRALYTLQQGGPERISQATLTLKVLYSPNNTTISISPSGPVLEGSSLTLTCSSKANPPVQTYTWYKVRGREMGTIGTGLTLTVNVTEASRSELYHCEAQNDQGKENSTSVQLDIIYKPQISGSGSCNRTATRISCSCESHGNPSPSMEWHVSGLRVTNSTDRVIREVRLGNTGLRSSLTMNHSQGVTPTLLCLSTNIVGSSSLQLHVPCLQPLLDYFSSGPLLVGVLVGTLMTSLLWCVALFLKQKMSKNFAKDSPEVQKRNVMENQIDPASVQREPKPSLPLKPVEDIYANHPMVASKKREEGQREDTHTPRLTPTMTHEQAGEDTLHYASVKFTARKTDKEIAAHPIYDNV
ncbi:hypothetical protein GJAV_G00010360 [Gymnothorax javanicus]|nr:hypothetical protein GJAV_G00010360 [Gymnothorax javanicus]